jgi:hypothetical protein
VQVVEIIIPMVTTIRAMETAGETMKTILQIVTQIIIQWGTSKM